MELVERGRHGIQVLVDIRKSRDTIGDLRAEASPSLAGIQSVCAALRHSFVAASNLEILSSCA